MLTEEMFGMFFVSLKSSLTKALLLHCKYTEVRLLLYTGVALQTPRCLCRGPSVIHKLRMFSVGNKSQCRTIAPRLIRIYLLSAKAVMCFRCMQAQSIIPANRRKSAINRYGDMILFWAFKKKVGTGKARKRKIYR